MLAGGEWRQDLEEVTAIDGAGAHHPDRPRSLVTRPPNVALHRVQTPLQVETGVAVPVMPLFVSRMAATPENAAAAVTPMSKRRP